MLYRCPFSLIIFNREMDFLLKDVPLLAKFQQTFQLLIKLSLKKREISNSTPRLKSSLFTHHFLPWDQPGKDHTPGSCQLHQLLRQHAWAPGYTHQLKSQEPETVTEYEKPSPEYSVNPQKTRFLFKKKQNLQISNLRYYSQPFYLLIALPLKA